MPRIDRVIHREVEVVKTARLQQMLGIFDVAPSPKSEQDWKIAIDMPDEWHVGVIVGPSGSGKSTVARELFGDKLVSGWDWPERKSVLDGFPEAMSIKDVTGILSSVGFSSPPAWVRPFHVLSNGQQFRCSLARTLAEMPELAVVDEFTSVVDRTVAQIGSAAVAKTVRRRGQKFVAVTCHYDVLDWLEPDWVYEPHTGSFRLNVGPDGSRGSLWRRPPIELDIARVHSSAWELFKPHHYLTASLHPSASCFVGFVNGQPAAFDAWLPFVGKLKDKRKARRGHRTVCLPDFQGVGIGAAIFNYVASLWTSMGYRAFSCTAHPAEIRSRTKSNLWKMTRAPGFTARDTGKKAVFMAGTRAIGRLTASFEYVGAPMDRGKACALLHG